MEKYRQMTLEILERLIATDTTSPPGNEAAAAEYLAGVLRPYGFRTELQEVAPGRANLVATLPGRGPHIALCGHLDVVAARPEHWDVPPFSLTERAGRYYGRGTSDMKGAISAMVAAACAFAEGKRGGDCTLSLVFVADEEVDGAGTRRYLADSPLPDLVLLGEPTGMDVCVGHRGTSRYILDFIGKSGHSSAPALACSPIYPVARFLLEAQRHDKEVLAQAPHPVLGPATLAVTMVEAGEQSNSIPGNCRVTLDRRTLPGEDRAAVAGELRALMERADISQPWPEPQFFVEVAAGYQSAESDLQSRCVEVLEAMGIEAAVRGFGACCDQYQFTRAGVACVIVGPGSLEQAHVANEFISREQLFLALEFYTRFLRQSGAR